MSESADAAGSEKEKRRWRAWIKAWLAAMAGSAVLLVVVLVWHPVYTASIEGTSESIELQTFTKEQHWRMPGFRIQACPDSVPPEVAQSMEKQVVLVRPGARVRFEKLEDGATVRIDVSSLKESEPDGLAPEGRCGASMVDVVDARGDVRRLAGSHVQFTREFKATLDQPWQEPGVVLPVHGTLILGEELGEGVETMLTGGTVTMHADPADWLSWLIGKVRKNTYAGESVPLARGDRVLPSDAQREQREGHAALGAPDPGATGYVRIGAKGPLQFGIIEPTRSVTIQRAGIANVEVDMSLWQRLQNEPVLTTLLAIMVALIAMVELREAFAVPFEHWRR